MQDEVDTLLRALMTQRAAAGVADTPIQLARKQSASMHAELTGGTPVGVRRGGLSAGAAFFEQVGDQFVERYINIDGVELGFTSYREWTFDTVTVETEVGSRRLDDDGAARATIVLKNITKGDALIYAPHLVLNVSPGTFERPDEVDNTFGVLAIESDAAVLGSPVELEDHPVIEPPADESEHAESEAEEEISS